MSDDLDNLLRAAMKTLDDEVPSGYFEALPMQTLARLEGSMHQGTTGTSQTLDPSASAPPPVVAAPAAAEADRDEDSGLHDIRNLAQSTKQRLSSRKITVNPPIKEDDVLASSSAGWKAVALPQPAKMVALPELEDLPSKKDVLAKEKAVAKEKAKAASAARSSGPAIAPRADALVAQVTDIAPVPAAPARSSGFSLPSQQRSKSKGPVIALVGMGLAAAAGGLIFMKTQSSDKASNAGAPAGARRQDEAMPARDRGAMGAGSAAAAAVAAPAVAPAPAPDEAKAATDTAVAPGAAEGAALATGNADAKTHAKGGKTAHKPEVQKDDKNKDQEKTPEVKDPTPPPPPKKTAGGGKEGEPNFDELLKEAGVNDKKEVKPKLEKKSLSGDDFKHGMAAVNAKAQGCYKGTQGTASVKLTISPSGAVSKVSVTGQFSGTPEGNCVTNAVKAASFPAWDGGPMSFNYSYLLSE